MIRRTFLQILGLSAIAPAAFASLPDKTKWYRRSGSRPASDKDVEVVYRHRIKQREYRHEIEELYISQIHPKTAKRIGLGKNDDVIFLKNGSTIKVFHST